MRQRIGPYRIENVIGEGGMGLVYKGRHDTLGRCAAIKALLPKNALDATARQRLIHEARAQALLTHDNIVAIYDFIPEDGELFIAMEYVDGQTVSELLRRSPNGRLGTGEALPLMLQVLAALEHVHHEKITHRDIKPSNVLVCNGVVKLTDFGIAIVPDATRLTAHQQMIGTPEYMSPEQLQGHDVDHRSDIYSAGLVLYAMLAGHPPFPAREPLAALSQRMAGVPDLRAIAPEIPAGICETLGIALQVEPDERFRSAAVFRGVLQDIAAGFLHTALDPQEEIPTEVLHDAVVTVETVAAPDQTRPAPVMSWIVIATTVTAAAYLLVQQRTRVPEKPAKATEARIVTRLPAVELPATVTFEPATNTDMVVPTGAADSTDTPTETAVDPGVNRAQEIATLREEIRTALTQAETALHEERFDDAIQEFEAAARAAQLYADEFWQERDAIASLRTRLIDARVAVETRKQREALWMTRLANVEEDLRRERWPEAERFAKEIADDAQAPAPVAARASELLRQAKEGRISTFQQTRVGSTTNTTVRKPSSPPRKND